ncbi:MULTISPECIES: helix-turn-helix domain-containing protein [unclassified Pseudonocardia]|jgi:predicted ArsR family transcriptional regulator|uniref:helix-turn-helix transcriptional regulator n=1 Tax=unclassified Pseudonocardia TaxID=2619320 RepID=UPI000962EAE3|nr:MULTISPECIES: helix-turn-helix domain-containing protein [unclassified Pseudonocardia]MBN9096901.1 helix-turn-helix domain-containing protein [Pseudonocardia sp.]OJY38813.1 MAG: ArsR family transcriptional regulator [Pseudonocardia sp. 73-21]
MNERRERVLGAVRRATDGVAGVPEVAEHLGVHPNTARFHLEALVSDGVLERVPGVPTGRGRPRVGYRARPGSARGEVRRYRLLAEILLGQLSATSDDPPATATAVGRSWGAHLVPRRTPSPDMITRDEATTRLITMLDELDFAPEPVSEGPTPPDRVRLRHCPFLELAEPHRDLVCPLHLGLMQGALNALQAPVTVASLKPFAEPSACVAHLTPARRRRRTP